MKFWKTILNNSENLGKWREDYKSTFSMIEEEKKIYKILHARFLRMLGIEIKEKNPINYTVSIIWRDHICRNLGAKFTSVRKSKEHFYINDPATDFAINYLDRKPPIYIEINKETALKILTVGYIP